MREFKTAAKQELTDDDYLKFKVDDVEVVSVRPTEGQLVMLMAAEASEIRSNDSRMAATIDFALSVFDEDSRRYLGHRLLASEDPFGLDNLLEILQWVIEEWSNHPTKPSSDSTSSSENGGTSSTAAALPSESTSSPSPQLVPAT